MLLSLPQATTSLYQISGNGIAKMIAEPDKLGSPGWTNEQTEQLVNWPI